MKIYKKNNKAYILYICIIENNIPKNFLNFYEYVRNLSFEEKPNNEYLKELLKDLARKNNIDLETQLYDWNLKITMIKNHP